jgi:hypothetical protein
VKWRNPIYNLVGWQIAGAEATPDLLQAGEVITLEKPTVTHVERGVRWRFTHEAVDIDATLTLEAKNAEPRVQYTATVKKAGTWTFGYTGAPASDLAEVVELWQPLVWDGRRLPEHTFLIPDEHCSIPGCLVQTAGRTVGLVADPWQFPYEMPSSLIRRFGVSVRNAKGQAQPLVFAPFFGTKESQLKAGDAYEFAVVLIAKPANLSETFEHVARHVCGFRDRRENTVATLNQALDRMVEFALGPWGQFNAEEKAFAYPDSKGTVKNVSSLHPVSLATVMDDEAFFRTQAAPIMEFLLSREKFLFALGEEGMQSTQVPSMKLAGPAMPVSELAALARLSRGATPYFGQQAARLHPQDRMLNMDWVNKGDTWAGDLWMYRATGDSGWLKKASDKADRYIAERIEGEPADFSEAANGTFFDYMVPWWKELYELYLETHEPRHLAAAHRGARRYAQFVWFYPSIPEGEITVNKSGFAPRRGNLDKPGVLPVPEQTVAAWRVSEQGTICEGNGTVQRLGILLATHAPWFLRIAHDTGDEFLHDIARSAVIGRYANFPGYHTNTLYSTAQELADFPLHPYDELKPTTSFHYNHSLPMAAMMLDYLVSAAYARSNGAIDFPGEFAESYAYMQTRTYGGGAGKFYDMPDARLWMPRGLLRTDSIAVNHVAARGDGRLGVCLMNDSDRAIDALTFELDAKYFTSLPSACRATVWRDNQRQEATIEVVSGRGTISLSPKGTTAIVIDGLEPKVAFQGKFYGEQVSPPPPRSARFATAGGEAHVIALSFGPELTWAYGYLPATAQEIRAATFHVDTPSGRQTVRDEKFPFEFSAPLKASDAEMTVTVEAETVAGDKTSPSSATVRLTR